MITIAENEHIFDQTAASRVTDQIIRKPDSVIGLSTGRTTGNMHRIIADECKEADIDTSLVTFFGVDEITDVPREYHGSCYRMIRSQMLDRMGFDDENFLMLPTFSDDFGQACKDFVKEIEARGGIDLLILGLGENGHLGFNQPHSPYEKDAWVTDMDSELLARVRREVGENGDYKGITLGLQMIMNSRRIILVAKGGHKANAVKLMLNGKISTEFPASLLQMHPDCEFLLDTAAAALIKE